MPADGSKNLKDISKRPDFKEITAKGGRAGKGKLHMTTILKRYLKAQKKIFNPVSSKEESLTYAQIVVLRKIQSAIGGNDGAINDIWERIDGRVPQKVDQTHLVKKMPAVIIDGEELRIDIGEEPEAEEEEE